MRASATTRAPSSVLKALWRVVEAPTNAARPAACAVSSFRGRPMSACSAAADRHGRVATPPSAMRTSRTISPSISMPTAAETRAKAIGLAITDFDVSGRAGGFRQRYMYGLDEFVRAQMGLQMGSFAGLPVKIDKIQLPCARWTCNFDPRVESGQCRCEVTGINGYTGIRSTEKRVVSIQTLKRCATRCWLALVCTHKVHHGESSYSGFFGADCRRGLPYSAAAARLPA